MGDILLITFFILMTITYFVIKKRMHLFEIIFCWLVVVFVHNYYFMIITVNYKLLIPSPHLPDVFMRIGYQHIIAPIIVLLTLEWLRSKRGFIHKIFSVLFFLIVFMMLKKVMVELGIVVYSTSWHAWWSYLETLLLFCFSGITLIVFRCIMRKDGISI
jgi:hypothetical protein